MTERGVRFLRHGTAAVLLLLCLIAAACNTAAVKRSYMSLDPNGNRKRTAFYTDTAAIYCIGELAIGRKDASITAVLRSTALASPSSGELEPFASTLGVEDVTPGNAGEEVVVAFELKKTDTEGPWPAGEFVCDLFIDAELSASVPFRIDYPDCPLAPPREGDACAGFFLPQSRCVGALSAQSCVCAEEGSWACR